MCYKVKGLKNTHQIAVWQTEERESFLFSLLGKFSNDIYIFLICISQLFYVVQGM